MSVHLQDLVSLTTRGKLRELGSFKKLSKYVFLLKYGKFESKHTTNQSVIYKIHNIPMSII